MPEETEEAVISYLLKYIYIYIYIYIRISSTWRPGFGRWSGHVLFVVDEVALLRVFSILRFLSLIFIPLANSHSLIKLTWTPRSLNTDTFVK
jgi:hypothetical protein